MKINKSLKETKIEINYFKHRREIISNVKRNQNIFLMGERQTKNFLPQGKKHELNERKG